MKKIILLLLPAIIIIGGCKKESDEESDNTDYKQKMRDFVISISEYAKNIDSGFIIIPQNGHELISNTGDATGAAEMNYVGAIDALGQEDLFYGFDGDNIATPPASTSYLETFLDMAKEKGKAILVTDYCSTHIMMDDSYSKNYSKGYISYAAESRELDIISTYPAAPNNVNADSIASMAQVKNFLYLINPDLKFSTKQQFIAAIKATDFDLLITDLFFNEEPYTKDETAELKMKHNGGKRLIISYMSIGEAEDYRYYWQPSWKSNAPEWLAEENPEWKGNYKVRYWNKDWQGLIFGSNTSYLDKILNAGFNGAYLDIIEAFEYFE
jgi:cysteinyl-tRNA synthetase, unknown class